MNKYMIERTILNLDFVKGDFDDDNYTDDYANVLIVQEDLQILDHLGVDINDKHDYQNKLLNSAIIQLDDQKFSSHIKPLVNKLIELLANKAHLSKKVVKNIPLMKKFN